MSNDVLEMPKKKPSSTGRIIILIVAILAVLGLLAWRLLPGDKARELTDTARQQVGGLADAARRQVGGLVDKVTPAESPTPGENLRVSTVGEGATPGRVDGALTDAGAESGSASSTPIVSSGADGATTGENGAPDTLAAGREGNVVQPPAGGAASAPLVGDGSGAVGGGSTGGVDEGLADAAGQPDRVDRALAETSTASATLTPTQRAELPTVSSALTRLAAPEDAGRREDSVVTSDFFRNLARWLVDGYRPSARAGQSGRTTVSLIAANMRYGTGLYGLRHADGDSVRGREAVLRYVYTPGMLDALYRLYVDRFMADMARAALEGRSGGKQPLTDAQAADMFTVYAGSFRQVAAALRGVAAVPDLNARVLAVREAGQEVVRANGLFAEVLYAYEEARDAGRAADAEALRRKMIESSQMTEQAVRARSAARRSLADAVRRGAGGRTPGEDSLIYLAEWVRRRGDGAADATLMAANVLVRLADRFAAEAAALSGEGA